MAQNRMFVTQEAVDAWLSEERISIDDDVLTMRREGQAFRLRSAVRFVTELTGAGDPHDLVGRVKDLDQLKELGGEHCRDSVIIGDHAYEVVEGFVGTPLAPPEQHLPSGDSLTTAALAAVDRGGPTAEIDLLARFFLQSR